MFVLLNQVVEYFDTTWNFCSAEEEYENLRSPLKTKVVSESFIFVSLWLLNQLIRRIHGIYVTRVYFFIIKVCQRKTLKFNFKCFLEERKFE